MSTPAVTVPTQLVHTSGPLPTPETYKVPGSLEIQLSSVSATYDGSGAGGNFDPTLSIYSKDGKLISRTKVGGTVTAGDDAVATWLPFSRKAAQAGPAGTSGKYAWLRRWNTAQTIPSGVLTAIAWDNFYTTDNAYFYTAATPGGAATNTSGDPYLQTDVTGYAWTVVVDVLWNAAGASFTEGVADSTVGPSEALMSQVSTLATFDTRNDPVVVIVPQGTGDGIYLNVEQTSGVDKTCNVRMAVIAVSVAGAIGHVYG
jgi:hypothetical protein